MTLRQLLKLATGTLCGAALATHVAGCSEGVGIADSTIYPAAKPTDPVATLTFFGGALMPTKNGEAIQSLFPVGGVRVGKRRGAKVTAVPGLPFSCVTVSTDTECTIAGRLTPNQPYSFVFRQSGVADLTINASGTPANLLTHFKNEFATGAWTPSVTTGILADGEKLNPTIEMGSGKDVVKLQFDNGRMYLPGFQVRWEGLIGADTFEGIDANSGIPFTATKHP